MISRAAALIAGFGLLLGAACSGPGAQHVPCAGSGKPVVVAAENFWGSIVAQLAGDGVCVASVINNPDADPHAYEATPTDARLLASARYFVENGAGYDPWAPKLVSANPASRRTVLDIASMAGKGNGDNPHLWYSPKIVVQVIDRVASDLSAIDPAGKAGYERRRDSFKTEALAGYTRTIEAIAAKYPGTPVGATESIFSYLAEATRLSLVTPREYMRAVSEGSEPPAADRATAQQQIQRGEIRVLVYNGQNSTKDVQALVAAARAQGIPVVTVTETLAPAGATFQAWQTRQLKDLLAALGG